MQTSTIQRENVNAQSGRFCQRIGRATYRVAIHFPCEEGETLEAKILRLIKNDLRLQAESATMESLQTGQLPEGGSL